MEILYLIGGPALGVLTAIVAVQRWALAQAKKEGIREQREQTQVEQIDAAHDKIRGVTMRVEALEKTAAKDEERHEAFARVQSELREDIKAILATVQNVAQTVSHLEGKVEGAGK